MLKVLTMFLPLFVVGCGGGLGNTVKPEVAQKHGATQLGCDPAKVKATPVDSTTWKVEGCEKSIVLTCWTSVGMGEGTCVKQP